MAYREPTAGLLVRIAELEHQLEQVRRERESPFGGALSRLLGAPFRVQVERSLPFELDPAKHDRVVEALQRRFDAQGQFLAVGRSCHWSLLTAPNQRDLNVSMVVRDGATTVRASERFKNTFGMCFVWAFILGLPVAMSVPVLVRPGRVELLVIWGALALLGLLAIRASFASIVRFRARQLGATVEELVAISTSDR